MTEQVSGGQKGPVNQLPAAASQESGGGQRRGAAQRKGVASALKKKRVSSGLSLGVTQQENAAGSTNGNGHPRNVTQLSFAVPVPEQESGHVMCVTLNERAPLPEQGKDHFPLVSLLEDVDPLLYKIQQLHRSREDFLRLRNATILRAKAICRRWVGGDKTKGTALYERLEKLKQGSKQVETASAEDLEHRLYLADHFAAIQQAGKRASFYEKELAKAAAELPIADFVNDISGLGFVGTGQILACAGDLRKYPNPAKLWTRMGLGRVCINGKWTNQRKMAGEGGIEMQYSPRRRAIMFIVTGMMLRKQNRYRDLYLERKAQEREKLPPCGCPVVAEKPSWKQSHEKDCPKHGGYPMIWDRRAQRYVAKRLLRDLWRAWRDQLGRDTNSEPVSP